MVVYFFIEGEQKAHFFGRVFDEPSFITFFLIMNYMLI